MKIRCLVEREGNRHVLRVEGIPYTFERNEHGHLIAEVNNEEHIRWMMRSTSYQAYSPPKIIQEEVVSAAEVSVNPIFQDGPGEYGGLVLHEPEPEQPEAAEETPAPKVRRLRNPSRKKR